MELKHMGRRFRRSEARLLIVPYGIETSFHKLRYDQTEAFNRTLWN